MSDQFTNIASRLSELQSEINELSHLSIGDRAEQLLQKAIDKLNEAEKLIHEAEMASGDEEE